MSSKMILVKDEGSIIPQLMIEKAAKACTSFIGLVGVASNPAAIEIEHSIGMPPVEEIMGMQEKFKDNLLGLFFGQAEGLIPEEEYQPIVLLANAAHEPQIVVMLEGDYHNPEYKDSPYSGEYHMVNDILRPQVEKLKKITGGDLTKLIEEMKDKSFHTLLKATAGSRGIVSLFFADGTQMNIVKGDTAQEFEWGFTSNKLDYEEKSSKDVVIEKVEEPPKKKAFGFSGAIKRAVAAVTPAVPTPKAPSPLVKLEDNASPVAIEAGKEPPTLTPEVRAIPEYNALKEERGKVFIQAPHTIKHKQDRRAWYKEWTVLQSGGEPVSKYKEIPGPFAEANQKFLDARKGIVKDFKDMKGAEPKTAPKQPIMPPEMLKAVKNLLTSDKAKAVMANGQVLDSVALKSAKLATFTQQVPELFKSIEDTFRLDYQLMVDLPKEALAQLCIEYRLNLMSLMVDDAIKDGKNTETVPDKAPPAPTETVVEPPKKKRLSFASR